MLLPPIAATLLLLALALALPPLWLSERVTNKVPAGGAKKNELASAGDVLLWTTQGRTACESTTAPIPWQQDVQHHTARSMLLCHLLVLTTVFHLARDCQIRLDGNISFCNVEPQCIICSPRSTAAKTL
jgi:hypothetical protein